MLLLVILILLIIYDIYSTISIERYTTNEAVQSVSSLYNNQNMTVTNMNVIDKLTGKDATFTGTLTGNKVSVTDMGLSGNVFTGSSTSRTFAAGMDLLPSVNSGTDLGPHSDYYNTSLKTPSIFGTSDPGNYAIMCPVGSYMVGLKGRQAVCKSFK